MVTKELNHSRKICFPIVRPALQVHEYRGDAGFQEECYGIFKVFVEIGIEDALVHEMRSRTDVKNNPAKVMQSERRKHIRLTRDRRLDRRTVLSDHRFFPGLDLRDNGEAIICRSSRENRAVASLLKLEISLFRDGHRCSVR